MRSFKICTPHQLLFGDQIKNEMGRAHMCEKTNAYRVLMQKPEGKRPLIRSSSRLEDNIKREPKETGYKTPQKIHPLLFLSKSVAVVSPQLVLVAANMLRICKCKHSNQSRKQGDTAKHWTVPSACPQWLSCPAPEPPACAEAAPQLPGHAPHRLYSWPPPSLPHVGWYHKHPC